MLVEVGPYQLDGFSEFAAETSVEKAPSALPKATIVD
jgi:hypothetical protein